MKPKNPPQLFRAIKSHRSVNKHRPQKHRFSVLDSAIFPATEENNLNEIMNHPSSSKEQKKLVSVLRNHALRSPQRHAGRSAGDRSQDGSIRAGRRSSGPPHKCARPLRARTFRDLQRSRVFKVANPQNQRLLTNL